MPQRVKGQCCSVLHFFLLILRVDLHDQIFFPELLQPIVCIGGAERRSENTTKEIKTVKTLAAYQANIK